MFRTLLFDSNYKFVITLNIGFFMGVWRLTNEGVLDHLSSTITLLNLIYKDFNSDFYSKNVGELNLKNTYVYECEYDVNFNSNLVRYLNGVTEFLKDSDDYFSLQTTLSGSFRSRTKSIESTYAKIDYYSKKKSVKGRVAINKCLNDLFGSRIIIPDVRNNLAAILNFLEDLKNKKIISRYYVRDKNDGYFAIHCYFKQDNLKFPWEFQIWDHIDQHSNTQAHNAHEREKRGKV